MNIRNSVLLVLYVVILSACGEDRKNSQNDTAQTEVQETSQDVIASEDVEITTNDTFEYEIVVPEVEIGWGMAFLPDSSILITEKSGELIHFKNGEKHQVQQVPDVYNRGQGGFLDIALHPDYASNGWIYFSFASSEGPEDGGNTELIRAKLENGQLVQTESLYKATPNTTAGQHFGSRIVFDNEGYLYFTIGDRGNNKDNPQDLTRDAGKTYRFNDDGSIPSDNPFVGEENAKEAIYSYGHRNAQGMALHPESGEIWNHEHGPQGGDEINVEIKGANYGWPAVTYGIGYDNSVISEETSGPDYQEPIFHWTPSIAPSGMAFITSDEYPELQGNLLVGSLKFLYVEHLVLNGKKVEKREKLLENIGRIRDVRQAPDGFIYVSVEGMGIVKLLKKDGQ